MSLLRSLHCHRMSKRSCPHEKFSEAEDVKLVELVNRFQREIWTWAKIAEEMGTKTARQCRERWQFYLDPSINKTPFSDEEKHGNKWVSFSRRFKRRTSAQLKNRYAILKRNSEKKLRKAHLATEFQHPVVLVPRLDPTEWSDIEDQFPKDDLPTIPNEAEETPIERPVEHVPKKRRYKLVLKPVPDLPSSTFPEDFPPITFPEDDYSPPCIPEFEAFDFYNQYYG